MFRLVMFSLGGAWFKNRSRDRHDSIFDGAEWDKSWQVPVRRCAAGCVRLGHSSVAYENLSHGRHGASSMAQRGIKSGSGMASLVEMRRDMTWSVLAVSVMETTLLVSKRATASVAEWDAVNRVVAMLGVSRYGVSGCGLACHGNHLHVRRGCSFDAARWDAPRLFRVRRVALSSGLLRHGNHHRLGTESDQRGRGGMN